MAPAKTPQSNVDIAWRNTFRQSNPHRLRYVPSDDLFQAIEDAVASNASPDTFRMLALREVQKLRIDPCEKIEMFIPAARLTATFRLDEILLSLHQEAQTATWTMALDSLCDFVSIKSRGLKFHCLDKAVAQKLGGTAIRCMGKQFLVQPYRRFGDWYFVELNKVPMGLSDDAIAGYFEPMDIPFMLTPSTKPGLIDSRDRVVWFRSKTAPVRLFSADRQPLREISFPDFPDPVYVHHKSRAYNQVTPPSIVAKKAAAKVAKGFQPSKNILRHIDLEQSQPAAIITPAPEPPLTCPTVKDSFDTWSQVSKQINCRAPPPLPQGKVVDIMACTEEEEAFFDLPITPTGYQLAFSPLEDDEGHEITCVVTVEDCGVIRSNPLYPMDPVARMLEEQCLHTDPRKLLNKAHRRSHIAAAQVVFMELKDPETRLAAIAAQPTIIAPVFQAPSLAQHIMVPDHAILRAISSGSSEHYGDSSSLVSRITHHYGDTIPTQAALFADLFPGDEAQTLALAFASFDLYHRAYGSTLYMNPVSVAALINDDQPGYLKHSHFLLWDDRVLMALAAELSSHLLSTAPKYIGDACSLLGYTLSCADDLIEKSGMDSTMDLSDATDLVGRTTMDSTRL